MLSMFFGISGQVFTDSGNMFMGILGAETMKKKWLMSIVIVLCMSGCSLVGNLALERSQDELGEIEMLRQTAENQLMASELQVAMIKAYLGDEINQLPVVAVEAINEIEQIALNYDPNTITDTELGRLLGLRARAFCALVRQWLKDNAPELLRYLP